MLSLRHCPGVDDFTETSQPKTHSFFDVIDFSAQGAALEKLLSSERLLLCPRDFEHQSMWLKDRSSGRNKNKQGDTEKHRGSIFLWCIAPRIL